MNSDLLTWGLLAAPAALPFGMTLLNLLTWQRGEASAEHDVRVSVLIPARNEAAHIERAVRAAAASSHAVHEIIVCNDHSTDGTGAILDRLRGEVPTLRVIDGKPLPSGWIGKPHACAQLARAATGDVLLFVDADTTLDPDGVRRVLSLMREGGGGADLVTAVPRQRMGSLGERAIIPLLVLTYTSWFPLRLVAASRDPRFLAANGQLLAVNAGTYQRIGGFEEVRHEIVDDMAFCRLAKTSGAVVCFADGFEMASCRMYGSARDVWRGFSKNAYEGIGGTPWALAAVALLHLLVFVAPFVALPLALVWPALAAPAAAGVALNLTLRALLAWRYRHGATAVAMHPLAVLGLLAILVNSARWTSRGQLWWAGRRYAARKDRAVA